MEHFESLKKRITIFLEESDWARAVEYCEKCLDIDPECAEVYFYFVLADLKLSNAQKIATTDKAISENKNFKKALQYASDEFKGKLIEYEIENIYNRAKNIIEYANSISEYNNAIELLSKIPNFKDSSAKILECKKSISSLEAHNKKIKKTCFIYGIIIACVIIFMCVTSAIENYQKELENQRIRDERAQTIHANFNGLSFGKIIDTTLNHSQPGGPNNGFEWVNEYAATITETTNFSFSNGKVDYKYEKSVSGRGWQAIFVLTEDEEKGESDEYSGEYKVSISREGEITVTVGYQTLTVDVDENDIPISISDFFTTYVPESSYSYKDEEIINRMSNGLERW